MGIGNRIRQVLNERQKSGRWLGRELEKQGVRGSSRNMVQRYLNDSPEPPAEFARAVVKYVFPDLREEWLLTGHGPKTHAETEVAAVIAKGGRGSDEWRRKARSRTLLPTDAPDWMHSACAQWADLSVSPLPSPLKELEWRLLNAFIEVGSGEFTTPKALEMTAFFVIGPLAMRGVEEIDVNDERTKDYVVAMLHALTLAPRVR